jgi:hypothetical protein
MFLLSLVSLYSVYSYSKALLQRPRVQSALELTQKDPILGSSACTNVYCCPEAIRGTESRRMMDSSRNVRRPGTKMDYGFVGAKRRTELALVTHISVVFARAKT